jgi:hypothetical protein
MKHLRSGNRESHQTAITLERAHALFTSFPQNCQTNTGENHLGKTTLIHNRHHGFSCDTTRRESQSIPYFTQKYFLIPMAW